MDSDTDSPSDESTERMSRETPNFFTIKSLLAIAVFSILFSPVASSDFESHYDRHCGRIVARFPADPDHVELPFAMPSGVSPGYFTGGAPIFDANGSAVKALRITFLRGVADGVSELRATLTLEAYSPLPDSVNGGLTNSTPNPRLVRFRGPRARMEGRRSRLRLRGFWSEESRELCMVGSGSTRNVGTPKSVSLSAVLKLTYPRNSTIYGSLVKGSLESLDGNDSHAYFAPVFIIGVAQDSGHNYTLVKKDSGCLTGVNGEGVQVSSLSENACSVLRKLEIVELEYSRADSNLLSGGFGFVPRNMVFSRSRCTEDKKWLMVLSFPNSSYIDYRLSFDPNTALVGEGGCNEKGDQFCGVACRILNVSGESFDRGSIGDCSTGFSLRIRTSFSLRNRSNVVGKMWSTVGHFGEVGFNHFDRMLMRFVDFKYGYTVIDDAFTRSCAEKNSAASKGKKYPAEDSFDMRFDMSVKFGKGLNAYGHSKPFFVRNRWAGSGFYPRTGQPEVSVMSNNRLGSLVNISYDISFSVPTGFKFDGASGGSGDSPSSQDLVIISAEGIYNRDFGALCMIGCRKVSLNGQNSLDCEIAVNIQFSSLGAKNNKDFKGTIKSTRKRSDPLYFEGLKLSSTSMYIGQAEESIWRMDLEITMVLVSKTLTCMFVGLQLFYVKSRPEVLPFTSVAMLVVLTVGHMIPLLLNFEALFASHRTQQTDFVRNGGWLEVNEVVVRIVTMVAFLLQLRLLHLTWSSRKSGDPNENRSWGSQRKVFYVMLPLYACGTLIAWIASHLKNSPTLGFRNPHRMTYVVTPFQRQSLQRVSLWADLKSYAGLVMDGFLFPQILFNVSSGSGEKALAPVFYAGTTVVRILPHAYDLYRARSFSPFMDWSYIYASHKADFFSTAWNIVIPCGGLFFATLIFLQQRFGGRCVLPRRFRESSVYEKVPAIGNDEL